MPDNFTFPFDQSIHSNVDEDLGIINRNLQIISCGSDFEIHKLDPFYFQKSELDNQLIEYRSSLSTRLEYHEEHSEDISLEKELAEFENEFQSICSSYNLIKNQIFKDKLIQTNILKNKKSHAFVHFKEADDSNQSSPIHNKTHTYDVDLVDP